MIKDNNAASSSRFLDDVDGLGIVNILDLSLVTEVLLDCGCLRTEGEAIAVEGYTILFATKVLNLNIVLLKAEVSLEFSCSRVQDVELGVGFGSVRRRLKILQSGDDSTWLIGKRYVLI
jgi:hypothetical protein